MDTKSDVTPLPDAEFIKLLRSAAAYNDKGHIWLRHSREQQEAFWNTTEDRLRRLAGVIGEQRLGPELWEAVSSGAAVYDGSGYFGDLAAQVLGMDRFGSVPDWSAEASAETARGSSNGSTYE
jgi:hypothetical protein